MICFYAYNSHLHTLSPPSPPYPLVETWEPFHQGFHSTPVMPQRLLEKLLLFFFLQKFLRRFSTKTFNVNQTPLPKYVVLILVNTIIDCLCLVFVNVKCNIPSVICRLLANVNNNDGKKQNKTKQKQKTIVLDQQNKTFTLFCAIPCGLCTSTTPTLFLVTFEIKL